MLASSTTMTPPDLIAKLEARMQAMVAEYETSTKRCKKYYGERQWLRAKMQKQIGERFPGWAED